MDKLKACPFCGSDDVSLWLTGVEHIETYTVSCSKCSGAIVGDRRIEAIEAWNNRAELEEYKKKLVEKLNQRHKSNIKHSKDGDCLQMTIYENRVVEDVAIIKLIESGELE